MGVKKRLVEAAGGEVVVGEAVSRVVVGWEPEAVGGEVVS